MPNIIEAVTNLVKTFTDNEPKNPLNIGEAMNCWMYLTVLQEMIAFEEAGLNTTTDNTLKGMLQDAIKLCESQVSRLKKFMKDEGIQLPPVSPDKPKSDPNSVPLGVKLSDDEIANGVSLKIAAANVACATGQSEAIRNDIALLWIEFQAEVMTFGSTLKTMMRKRGWIKSPPYYYPPGIPKQ